MNKNITIIILLGGKSKRMGGGNKSLLKINGVKIFDKILNKLLPKTNKIIINCNEGEKKFLKYQYPIVKDSFTGFLGPLAGIHAGMKWIVNNNPKCDWLISLPSDTPFIPNNLISELKKKMTPKIKIILVKYNGKIHPVIGAWHISLFENLAEEIDLGTRKILSWAENHPIDFVNYLEKDHDPFFNINDKKDLKLASEIDKKI